jgi:uncharacterized protein (DUF2147 family)
VLGEWLMNGGSARVVIRPCGANLCGLVNWTKEDGELGAQVFRDLKPVGASRWEGTVHDPDTGRRYASNISLGADDALRVEGCVIDTLCSGQAWARVKGKARTPARQQRP